MRAIRGEMRAAASSSLTVPQLRALLFVRRNPGTNLSALADHLGIGLTGASGLVDRLVRNEMLARETDPNERRRIRLTVTNQGTQRIDGANTATRRVVATLLADLTPEEAGTIEEAMRTLRRAFQGDAAA
jgi:DNA-binding MarR family transcriptional regulator